MLRLDPTSTRTATSGVKSQTLSKFEGHDEETETVDAHFEILSIASSCPDLSILEEEAGALIPSTKRQTAMVQGGDVVDGIDVFQKVLAHNKIPLTVRRSTSLNSLGDSEFNRGEVTTVDGASGSVLREPGIVAKAINQLEKTLKSKDSVHPYQKSGVGPGFNPATAAYVYNGGSFLHKSVSSPSVSHISQFTHITGEHHHRQKHLNLLSHPPRVIPQQHSKRSFFRRKHKSKMNLHSSSSASSVSKNYPADMDGFTGEENLQGMIGFAALSDPVLRLQETEPEVWTLSMSQDVVAGLNEKDRKRQEHMYELILTEKNHCLTLALMDHLFIGGMKRCGFAREARLLFPDLKDLLHVHFSFLKSMRDKQQKYRRKSQPLDSLADTLVAHFTPERCRLMIKLYGFLCSTHTQSLELFKNLSKDQKFASLVASWDKEAILGRKNVRECLLLVAQRITKYPLLIERLLKTAVTENEEKLISKSLQAAKDLISKVDERVHERVLLVELCKNVDSKSSVLVGQRRKGRDDLVALRKRRLIFKGQALVSSNRLTSGSSSSSNSSGTPGNSRHIHCFVYILTDCLVFAQEISGRLHFVNPFGIVMLSNLLVRENATHNASVFLVFGSGTKKPEMIELQVLEPERRDIWLEQIRDAVAKSTEETEATSDAEEDSSDATDFSDARTVRAMEELQELDKHILMMLRNRSRLVESVRSDKPHYWSVNNFDGKNSVMSAISTASSELQRLVHHLNSGGSSGVNRSASCAGEYAGSGVVPGLPRRADTFGGFDSQQRSNYDLSLHSNSKVMFNMVAQLSDLCGEVFQQMVPQLTPNVYHSQHQLQRRMEELREVQHRLEAEKALWQQELSSQKDELEKTRSELNTMKESLQKEQADISQQREQLYRKLEALQRQGINPALDPVSPVTTTTNSDKQNVPVIVARRPPQVVSQPSVPPATTNGAKTRQQLPLHLAASSSFKGILASPPAGASDIPKSLSRTASSASKVVSPSMSQGASETVAAAGASAPPPGRLNHQGSRRGAYPPPSNPIQQMIPMKLSENLASKTSSLPRGVGSRSVSSMMNQMDQQQSFGQQMPHHLRTSASVSHFSHTPVTSSAAEGTATPVSSYNLRQDRVEYFKNTHTVGGHYNNHSNNGFGDYRVDNGNNNGSSGNNVPIVHRRSGSSPVPITGAAPPIPPPSPFANRDDDFDSTKVLFL